MARTKITPTLLTAENAVASGAGITIDSTLVSNGVYIDADGDVERLVIRVVNSHASAAKTFTVKAAPAENGYPLGGGYQFLAPQGDIVTSVASSGDMMLAGLVSARHVTKDPDSGDRGVVLIDFENGFTGAIRVYKLPKEIF